MNEVRKDCEFFEMKRWPHDCGDCQTDGHYLCGGCRNIAPFEEMELSDNRMRYYENQEKQLINDEEIEELYKRKAELLDEYGIFGGGGGWLSNYQFKCKKCHREKTNKDFGYKQVVEMPKLFP